MTIRWPWVSRKETEEHKRCAALAGHVWNYLALHDPIAVADWIRDARTEILELRARIADRVEAEQRYADLLSRYHMLKLQGAAEVEPVKPIVAKPADPVMAAFNEAMAGKGPKVRKQGLAQLERDKVARLSAAQIIARIHRGNRPADELADETPTPKRTASGS